MGHKDFCALFQVVDPSSDFDWEYRTLIKSSPISLSDQNHSISTADINFAFSFCFRSIISNDVDRCLDHISPEYLPKKKETMATTTAATAASPAPLVLPSRGVARVKNVLSGDTVILLGKASSSNGKAPEVLFTLDNISAPRYVVLHSFRLCAIGLVGQRWIQ